MEKTTNDVLMILGTYLPNEKFGALLALANALTAAPKIGTVPFLDDLSREYSVTDNKIKAIKDLRTAILAGKVEGDSSLRWCKDTVEAYIDALSDPWNDPWSNPALYDEPPF